MRLSCMINAFSRLVQISLNPCQYNSMVRMGKEAIRSAQDGSQTRYLVYIMQYGAPQPKDAPSGGMVWSLVYTRVENKKT